MYHAQYEQMFACKRFCIYLWHDEPWLFSADIYMLKILLYILGILFLLTACTSEQIRFINKSFGYFKVMRVYPIDLSNTEKHVFHIKEHDSRRTVNINLCFDFISNAGNLKVVEGLRIKTRISMGKDTVALRKIANPRLVVVTGNYSVG